MSKSSTRLLGLLRFLGPLLLVGLIVYAKPLRLWGVLRHAELGWLVLAWALNLPQLGIKAYRWHLTVRWQGIRLSYGRALLAYFSSLLVGFLTPGRVGEMTKVFTLKFECGVPIARGLSSVIFDRVFDLYLLLALGSIGFVRYSVFPMLFGAGASSYAWAVIVALALLLIGPLLLVHGGFVRWLTDHLTRLPVLRRRREKLIEKSDQFAQGLAAFTAGRLLVCMALTVASYTIFFIQCLLCARALRFGVPFLDMVFLMAATNLMTFIPITISGLGTREACLIYFLKQIPQYLAQISPSQLDSTAVAFGLVIFIVFFVGGGLIGFVCWQWAPIGLRQAIGDVRAHRKENPTKETPRHGDNTE